MSEIIKSILLLLVLLNPFLIVVYLIDVMEKLDRKKFAVVLTRAGIVACLVFCFFVILGDCIFQNIMQASFASFQIFGGIVFLIIALQFVFRGPRSIEVLRGESENIAGALAMPVLIGPGTVSVSVIIGENHDPFLACMIVFLSLFLSLATILVLKRVHDYFRPRKQIIIERYIEIAGRIIPMFLGTISIEMIIRGLYAWVGK
jgi:small neutral amino acid transporter SnatA (MarC family)